MEPHCRFPVSLSEIKIGAQTLARKTLVKFIENFAS